MCVLSAVVVTGLPVVVAGLPVPWSARCRLTATRLLPCLALFMPQLKHGEIHSTVHAAAVLTDTQYALEVQMSAYTLLHILVSRSSSRANPRAHAAARRAHAAHLPAACKPRCCVCDISHTWLCCGMHTDIPCRCGTGGLSCQPVSSRRSRSLLTNT